MDRAFDIGPVVKLLRRGVEQGHWSEADLDVPSPGWAYNERHFRLHHPKYEQRPWRNLLRTDEPIEAVQPVNPRDLASPMPPTASSQPSDLPHQWPPDLSPDPDPTWF